jgi:hypothetical protein
VVVTIVNVGCSGSPHPHPGLTGGQKQSGIKRRCPTDVARWMYTPVKCGLSSNQEKWWGIGDVKIKGSNSHTFGSPRGGGDVLGAHRDLCSP